MLKNIYKFAFIIFFIFLADAMMSYTVPVLLTNHLHSSLWMGIIIGTSSIAGISCDFLFTKFFSRKNYVFFGIWLFLIAFSFPSSLLFLPKNIYIFLLSMIVWGIYFELIKFTQFQYINKNVHYKDHAKSWGIFEFIHAFSLFLAPIIAGYLLNKSENLALSTSMALYIIGFTLFIFFEIFRKKKKADFTQENIKANGVRSSAVEIKIWEIILKKLWPIWLMFFALALTDTAFWTIGVLLSEELKTQHFLGLFILPAYKIPFLFMPFFANKISLVWGKKRTSFVASIIGGLILFIGALFIHSYNLIFVIFAFSMFISICYPLIYATFEDYVSRSDEVQNDIVGIQNSAFSAAYIIGPILAGILSTFLRYEIIMGIFGLNLVIFAYIAIIFTPRKIKIPHKELLEVEN